MPDNLFCPSTRDGIV